MAAITRTSADARPTNDYLSIELTMDVAVQAGECVYIKSNGKGALADAGAAGTMPVRGVATMDCAAGRAVAIVVQGKFGGWSGMVPGTNIFAGTGGELDTAAGVVSQLVGYAVSATDLYVRPNL